MRTPRMYFHSRFSTSARVAALIIPRSATMQTEPIPNRFFNRSTMGTRLLDRKSTRLNSSHLGISYAVFCLKKRKRAAVSFFDGGRRALSTVTHHAAELGKLVLDYLIFFKRPAPDSVHPLSLQAGFPG